ncbi:MAG: hypothetical protein SF002_01895 [Alphaproteobacteria bacterium]|nr:hypothetical protein [Alphaproteobacteria bacterium]
MRRVLPLLAAAVLTLSAAPPTGLIGPFRLGDPLPAGSDLTTGGCDGRPMASASVLTRFGPAWVQAMADPTSLRIVDVEVMPSTLPRVAELSQCEALAVSIAADAGVAVLGGVDRGQDGTALTSRWHARAGASLSARWFPGGGSCDVTARWSRRPNEG